MESPVTVKALGSTYAENVAILRVYGRYMHWAIRLDGLTPVDYRSGVTVPLGAL